jgi:hypothetical protein
MQHALCVIIFDEHRITKRETHRTRDAYGAERFVREFNNNTRPLRIVFIPAPPSWV